MTPDWEKLQQIVDAALDLLPADRASFLDSACPDAQLRRRAEALIDAHDRAGSFLDDPIAESASELLDSYRKESNRAIAPGQEILGYRILSEIGRGGMGVVLKAQDPVLHRPVALKLLSPERLGGKSVSRLLREAQAASSLNHPNIVTIHGVLHTDTAVAIVMEFVEGVSLRQIYSPSLPLAEAARMARQIALALAAAHEAGIIHRDIKPENVIVRPDGYVKVVDFGLARDISLADSSTSSSITAGTLRYMSPEQLRGERLSAASDMFSLGLVLYELTNGRHPFAAASALETAFAIAHNTVAFPSAERPSFPGELQNLILALLAKEPTARPSASEVADALRRIEQPLPESLSRQRSPLRPAAKWVAMGAVAAGILALIAGAWSRVSERRPVTAPASEHIIRSPGMDDPIPPRHIYAIDPQGRLMTYVDNSADAGGFKNWIAERAATPPIDGIDWAAFKQVFAGGDGIIYGLTAKGELKYFRLLDPWRNKGHQRWSADSGRTIGSNFDRFIQVAALSPAAWTFADGRKLISHAKLIRGGTIWAHEHSGRVLLFQHGWDERGDVLPLTETGLDFTSQYVAPSLPAGARCPGCRILEGGDGIVYGLSRDGRLWRYRWRADGTPAKAAGSFASKDGEGAEIGHGWGALRSFAAPGDYSIEGYVRAGAREGKAGLPSVRPGDRVKIAASTFSPSYSVRLLRLQRRTEDDRTNASGLIDGVAVGESRTFNAPPGGNFKKAKHGKMYSAGAGWNSDGSDVVLPRSARSGIYAAELTTPSGGRHLAPFVVAPAADAKPNNVAVIANLTTWNAYNQWGGCSRDLLFEAGASAGGTCELSFDRPFQDPPWIGGARTATGLSDRNPRAFNQSIRAEIWILSWLDDLADKDSRYEYDVFSDVDLHQGISKLKQYKVLIVHTLPEFWTDQMRDHLDEYLNAGGHLVYLGGRGLYDRVVIASSGKLRIKTAPARNLFRWSSASYPDGRSERAVLGLAREREDRTGDPFLTGQPYVIVESHPFLVNGTNLHKDSLLGKVRGLTNNMAAGDWDLSWYQSGGECLDAPGELCSASHTTLAGVWLAAALGNAKSNGNSAIVYRKTETGSGWVFSIGSASVVGVLAIDATLQRVVQNALDAAISNRAP